MTDLVEKFIHANYPKFNKDDATVAKGNGGRKRGYYEYFNDEM